DSGISARRVRRKQESKTQIEQGKNHEASELHHTCKLSWCGAVGVWAPRKRAAQLQHFGVRAVADRGEAAPEQEWWNEQRAPPNLSGQAWRARLDAFDPAYGTDRSSAYGTRRASFQPA